MLYSCLCRCFWNSRLSSIVLAFNNAIVPFNRSRDHIWYHRFLTKYSVLKTMVSSPAPLSTKYNIYKIIRDNVGICCILIHLFLKSNTHRIPKHRAWIDIFWTTWTKYEDKFSVQNIKKKTVYLSGCMNQNTHFHKLTTDHVYTNQFGFKWNQNKSLNWLCSNGHHPEIKGGKKSVYEG